jgi:hypothetical protein
MTTSTAIPVTIQIRRSRLLGLLAGVAILTAAITWALSAFALDDSSSSTRRTSVLKARRSRPRPPRRMPPGCRGSWP